MKIEELKSGMNNVNLRAKIVDISEPREVMTKFGTSTVLSVATVEDETGTIKLTLWGNDSNGIEEGKDVEINGGFVKEFRDELQLNVGRKGTIKVV